MTEVPSPLIDKQAPEFTLPLLYDPTKKLSRADLLGKPYISQRVRQLVSQRASTNIRF